MAPNAHRASTPVFLPTLALILSSLLQVSTTTIPTDGHLPYFTPNHTLPHYALDFAPLVYLHSDEVFWPSDLNAHFDNVQPEINFTAIDSYLATGQTTQAFLRSTNLQSIDSGQQELTFLSAKQSIFDLDSSPWYNAPSLSGSPDLFHSKAYVSCGLYNKGSEAQVRQIRVEDQMLVPSSLLLTKPNKLGPAGFYSYNRGNYFYNNRFGDHVADWENTMIRFQNGKPMYVTPEAHGGQVMLGNSAFKYDILERVNGRPVVYSANGTHGMYPQAGQQNYTGLPVAIYDVTDKGHLWDPKLNYKSFFFSNEKGFTYTADTPLQQQDPENLGWLKFLGYWGDQKLGPSNPHQTCIGPMCFYEGGPLGPQSKSLARGWICGSSDCQPQSTLPRILTAGGERYNSPYSSSSTNRFNAFSGGVLTLLASYVMRIIFR